ncbi:hypothetical protein SO802_006805 [Lithocarpus litseifolius]|uniref:Uncharacterized protein n=1 Tax=Lithocarpus litseifolius TaxID=425828 RepID=A0AAW2DMB3_9ROSI
MQTHALPFLHTQNVGQRLHLQSKTQATISPSLPQLNSSTFSGTTLLQLYICLRYLSLTHNSFSPSLTLSSSLPQRVDTWVSTTRVSTSSSSSFGLDFW